MESDESTKARLKRIRMRSRLIFLGIGALLLVGICLFLVRTRFDSHNATIESSEGKSRREGETLISPIPFRGSSFESSGVAHVPGANGVLFVDDSRPGEIFWTQLDESGRQVGEVESVHTTAGVDDPESITYDGSYFYVIGSQSDPKAGKRNALIRFRFDAKSRNVTNLEKVEDVRSFLLRSIPELKGAGEKPGAEGGLSVEGIAWDPENRVLMLGLRSPMVEDQALLFPIRLKDSSAPLSIGSLELTGTPIKLRLGDLGVRDIHYDTRLKSFLIIAGAPKDREKGNFSLWQWDGGPHASGLRKITELDARLKPEGLTRVEVGGSDYLFLVFDSSSYAKLDYSSFSEN